MTTRRALSRTFGFLAAWCAAACGVAQEHVSHGLFKDIALYRPAGEASSVVLFLSGERGWTDEVIPMARSLVARGALVAGINTPQLFSELERDEGRCTFPDGDLENLSHFLQGYSRLATYHAPILVGYSSGATFAYAMGAQAPLGTFAGILSLGFCSELKLTKVLCKGESVHFKRKKDGEGMELLPVAKLSMPWVALQGENDSVCPSSGARHFVGQVLGAEFVELPKTSDAYAAGLAEPGPFLAAYAKIAAQTAVALPPPPRSLEDLPLVEVPVATTNDTFAILLSGDGGWAGLDRNVAAALSRKGVPVVGFDSLRYFWKARTPKGLADDIDRIIRYYVSRWKMKRVILIGYSQGADVLPFAFNRLPAASRSMVVQTVMMGLGERASFEFHLSNWVGGNKGSLPILPEAKRLDAARALCLYGQDEEDSLCPRIPAGHVRADALPGGHHFDGAYDALVQRILGHGEAR